MPVPEQASVAPVPGWEAMARVMVFVPVFTGLPPTSATLTAGWVVHTAPLAPPPGWVLKASSEAVPIVMVNGRLVPPARPVAVALIV